MRQNLGHILFGVIVAFLIIGTIFTYQVVAQSLNQLQFQAGSGYEITTGNASQNLDITTKATDGGAINIGSRQGTGIYIDTGNKVGIGITTPNDMLVIGSSSNMPANISLGQWVGMYLGQTNGSWHGLLGHNMKVASDNTFDVAATHSNFGYRGIVFDYSGTDKGIIFHTYYGSVTGGNNASSERMRITNAGNVGIGTTSPVHKLDVSGTGQFTQPVIVGTPTAASHAATKSYVDSAAGGGIGSGSSGQTLRHDGNTWIANDVIYNNGTYVGIGTTSPGAKLDVSGNINAAGINGTIITVGDASITNLLSVGSGGASDGISVDGDIEITGDISIGTVNPLSPLHVQNDTDAAENLARFVNYGGQGALLINEYRSDGGTSADPLWVINSFSGEAIAIAPGINGGSIGTTVTYFDDNGNVGIGTASPGYKLDVSGTGRFTQPVLVGTPTAAGHAATKSYVDSAAGSGITGSGSSGRLALWSGTNSLSSDGALTYSGSTGFKALHSLSNSDIAIGIHNTRYPYKRIDSWVSDGSGYLYGFGFKDSDGLSERINAFFRDNERGLYSADRLNVITFTSNEMGGTGLYPGYSIGAQILASGNSYINGGNLAIGKTSSLYTLDVAGTGSFSQPVIVGSPTVASHAATKSYVDSAITTGTGSYVLKAGDTMTGNLTIQKNTNPRLDLIAVNSGSDPATTASINITGYEGRGKGIFLTDADTSNQWFVGETYSTTGLSLGYDTTTNNQAEYPANSALFINTSRQVGIGTASPGYKLDVSGTGRFTQPVVVGTPTANDHAATKGYVDSAAALGGQWTDAGTYIHANNATDIVVTDTKRVGIGTTNPNYQLDIIATPSIEGLRVRGESTGQITIGNSFSDNWASVKGQTDNAISWSVGVDEETPNPALPSFGSLTAQDIFFFSSGSEVMRLKTNGNVGIGTNNPVSKLELEGTSANWTEATPGLTTGSLHIDPGSSSDHYGGAITFGASDSGSGDNAQAGIYTRTDGGYGSKMYFATTGSYATGAITRMMIDYDGEIGIGTTSPSYKLDVSGTGSFTQPVIVGTPTAATHATTKSYVDSAVSSGVSGGISGTQNYIAKFGATGNVVGNSQIFDNGTNVGIGTSSPGAKIEIYAPMSSYATAFTSPHLNLGASNTVDNDGFVGISYDTSTTANYGWSSGALRSSNGQGDFVWKFHSSSAEGAERMRLTNTGDLGIGTTSPGYKLDVSGTGRFTQPVIVGTPTASSHATTKSYVDSIVGGGSTNGAFDTLTANRAKVKEYILLDYDGDYTGSNYWAFVQDGTTRHIELDYGGIGSNKTLVATTDGKIGIGTVTPQEKLHVSGGYITGSTLRQASAQGAYNIVYDTFDGYSSGTLVGDSAGWTQATSNIWIWENGVMKSTSPNGDWGYEVTSPYNIQVDSYSIEIDMLDPADCCETYRVWFGDGYSIWYGYNDFRLYYPGGSDSGIAATESGYRTARIEVSPDIITATLYSNTGAAPVVVRNTAPPNSTQGYIKFNTENTGYFDNLRVDGVGVIGLAAIPKTNDLTEITHTNSIGIGTTSPSYTLDVSGTGSFSQPVIVGSPTADTHAATKSYVDSAASGGTLWASSGTNIYNTNSGNVGIGTSSPQAGMKIDVRSDGSTDGSSAITAYGYNGNEGMAVRGYGYATSGTGTNYGIVGLSAGSRASGINVGGHFYATGAPTNYALTTGAGNVGIGTTSPDFKLDISGSVRIEGSNLLYFGGTSTGDWSSRMSHTTGGLNINTNGLVINDVGYTGTKNYLTILNNGNIGINTTSPSYKLDVSGFGSFSTGVRIGSQSGTSGWFYYPNIISAQYNGNYTGAFVIHTNIARTSNEMFKIRVNGYGYGNQKNIDFTVVGYSYSGANGSVDGQSGAVVNYSIVDNGNDGLPKYIGIDANGKVAVSFGSHTTSYYYYRISADYWSTRINSDASSGWSIDQSTVAGFEWKDIKTMTPAITQLTTNYVGINNIAPSYILDVTGTGRFTQPVIVGTPTASDHAATKSYVDSATQGGGNSWVSKGNCSGTVAIDWSAGNTQHCTLVGATTFTFSGGSNGGSYKLILKQDAGGSKTVTWPGTTRWPSGSAPTLTTTGSKTDYVGFIYNGTDSTYDGVSFNANF